MPENVYWIWMQLLFGIGTKRAHEILEGCSCPRELLEDGASGEVRLTPEETAGSSATFEEARRLEEITLKKGVDIITPGHSDYPELLAGTYSKPIVLYVKGSLACLKNALPIAMVGTRAYTGYGEQAAQDIAAGLARTGCVVVSGLARGIDSICHAAALSEGGFTIGVMGCGLDIDYPKGMAPLKTAMKDRGAVVSEYPMGFEVRRHSFPVRNRVIAGMTRGCVVVEAPPESGSLITARLALDMGRDVFAIPGSIYSPDHVGVHNLLKEGGAKAAGCVQDILEEYPEYPQFEAAVNKNALVGTAIGKEGGPRKQGAPKKQESGLEQNLPKPDLPGDASEALCKVYAHMDENPKTADIIVARAGSSIGDVMAALTELEIMGFAQSHPGGFFSLQSTAN